jgi:hypothetical protein
MVDAEIGRLPTADKALDTLWVVVAVAPRATDEGTGTGPEPRLAGGDGCRRLHRKPASTCPVTVTGGVPSLRTTARCSHRGALVRYGARGVC